MKLKEFNLEEWHLVHKTTGECISIDILKTQDGGSFNKVFLNELASMIGCTGNGSEKVLGWILKNKNNQNEIHGTQREIAREENVGVATVARVFKALKDNGYLKQKRSGTYLLNPSVIHYGGVGNRLTILRIWNDLI
ncbi:replication/maintenance protein RepL [Symbiopectobacterium purcellii]|uniref:replication/maintenance protein RepL n=1 Tax=Symbiopectobacterium purcellii TaxID=2871826 RepID=UPI003F8594B7